MSIEDRIAHLPKLYTKEEVAQATRAALRTVDHWIAIGKLPSRKVGRRRLVAERDLLAFIGEEVPNAGDDR